MRHFSCFIYIFLYFIIFHCYNFFHCKFYFIVFFHIWVGLVYSVKATFNNISVISWRSILLVDETWVPVENHRPVTRHWQTLSHEVVSSTLHHERGSNSQISGDTHRLHRYFVNPTTIRSRRPPFFLI